MLEYGFLTNPKVETEMNAIVIFFVGSVFFVWISWLSLLNPLSHGFYRFLAWEFLLALVLVNLPMWTKNPLSSTQMTSWSLLMISITLGLHAVYVLIRLGMPNASRDEPELLPLEKTTILVTKGAYRYIRHPMYTALLLLAWGTFLKDISATSLVLVGGVSITLFYTAIREEEECKRYFGQNYQMYMRTSKRFIPFLF